MDDFICREEADQQYKRDKKVEGRILNILRKRVEDCILHEYPNNSIMDPENPCGKLQVKEARKGRSKKNNAT